MLLAYIFWNVMFKLSNPLTDITNHTMCYKISSNIVIQSYYNNDDTY